jgi:hypothetical protein
MSRGEKKGNPDARKPKHPKAEEVVPFSTFASSQKVAPKVASPKK